MITADLWKLTHPNCVGAAYIGPLDLAEKHRDKGHPYPADSYVLEREPCCQCCGQTHWQAGKPIYIYDNGQWRCGKHVDRNPCAIEGCTRTKNAKGFKRSCDDWICAEHWRRYVPPRSRMRRAYHAYFRKAKRFGWSPKLVEEYWRFWGLLVRRVRKRAENGQLDVEEINKIMGW